MRRRCSAEKETKQRSWHLHPCWHLFVCVAPSWCCLPFPAADEAPGHSSVQPLRVFIWQHSVYLEFYTGSKVISRYFYLTFDRMLRASASGDVWQKIPPRRSHWSMLVLNKSAAHFANLRARPSIAPTSAHKHVGTHSTFDELCVWRWMPYIYSRTPCQNIVSLRDLRSLYLQNNNALRHPPPCV